MGSWRNRAGFPPKVRERAVWIGVRARQDHASQWAAVISMVEKIGCAAETLRSWVRQAERDGGRWPGLTTDEGARKSAPVSLDTVSTTMTAAKEPGHARVDLRAPFNLRKE
jgi:transposase-like protein